jgi:hypothetical protein
VAIRPGRSRDMMFHIAREYVAGAGANRIVLISRRRIW